MLILSSIRIVKPERLSIRTQQPLLVIQNPLQWNRPQTGMKTGIQLQFVQLFISMVNAYMCIKVNMVKPGAPAWYYWSKQVKHLDGQIWMLFEASLINMIPNWINMIPKSNWCESQSLQLSSIQHH